MALLFTFFSGLFFLVGIVGFRLAKRKIELTNMAMACALVVIMGLIVFDLMPELLEMNKWWLVLFVLLGLVILILIDKIVPHHHHDHHDNDEEGEDHQSHLAHIGIVTILALLLHNIIEGMALYGVTLGNVKSGALMLLGIGLHNIPFGFQIATYNKSKYNKILLVLLILSGFIGGLIFSICGSINSTVEGIVIAITLGMLLHILIFELLKEVWLNIRKRESICGIIIGVVILVLINII